MAAILNLPISNQHYIFQLTEDEYSQGAQHLQQLGVNLNLPILGINTGAGGRWQLKQWRLEGFVELIERLHQCFHGQLQLLLLGGKAERERNQRIKDSSRAPVIDSGCDNAIRHVAALIRHCDVVLTGDTLAMHIALAMRRHVVVLFGPTSASEIDIYGLGEKIAPVMDCLSCYKTTCDLVPNCMDLISVDMVAEAVIRQLRHVREASSR